MLRNHEIEKTYEALVEGAPPHKTGTLKHHLRHGSYKAVIDPTGKEAILHYKVLKKKGKTTLLEIDLETGRYHQIRAQLSAIGCPIVGDKKYGSKMHHSPGIALTHVKVKFTHPVTKEKLIISI
jgi:23S rRNA pseudouridine1911/1915/1917 synthase